jgi:hypothetical protein
VNKPSVWDGRGVSIGVSSDQIVAATYRRQEQAAQKYNNDLAALSLGGKETQALQG